MSVPTLESSDSGGLGWFGVDVDTAVADGFDETRKSIESVGVYAVACGFSEETGA
jgi:hypothetical protein